MLKAAVTPQNISLLAQWLIGHITRDATGIEAREKPAPALVEAKPARLARKRGRPRKSAAVSTAHGAISNHFASPVPEFCKRLHRVVDFRSDNHPVRGP